jgi:hypothetical protein
MKSKSIPSNYPNQGVVGRRDRLLSFTSVYYYMLKQTRKYMELPWYFEIRFSDNTLVGCNQDSLIGIGLGIQKML